MPVAAGPAQPSCVVSITSGGGGAALAWPSSCVDVVPDAERYRGVPNRAQSLQMAGLSFEQSHHKMCYVTPNPVFREFVSNGVIFMHKTCLVDPFRAQVRCLTRVRHVRHQPASKASLW